MIINTKDKFASFNEVEEAMSRLESKAKGCIGEEIVVRLKQPGCLRNWYILKSVYTVGEIH